MPTGIYCDSAFSPLHLLLPCIYQPARVVAIWAAFEHTITGLRIEERNLISTT